MECTYTTDGDFLYVNAPFGRKDDLKHWGAKWSKKRRVWTMLYAWDNICFVENHLRGVCVDGQHHIESARAYAAQFKMARDCHWLMLDFARQQSVHNMRNPAPGYVYKLPPRDHQLLGLMLMHVFGRMPLFMDCGCLTGDSVISISVGGCGKKKTIADLFEYFHSNDPRRKLTPKVRSFDGERIRLHDIKDVVQSGVKQVFKLSLSDGKTLRATGDHEIMTRDGWVRVDALTLSHAVMVDNLTRHQKAQGEDKGRKRKFNDKRIAVGPFHPYARKQICRRSFSYLVEKHRAIYEAYHSGMSLEAFVAATRDENFDHSRLMFVNTNTHHIHHKNEDHYDNTPDNLELLPKEDHWKKHADGYKGYSHFSHEIPAYATVASVVPAGEEMTYDIVCNDPHRNFVANGIVVHNSGKTFLALVFFEQLVQMCKARKMLVLGKLMTLYGGWQAECHKFTNLDCEVFWEPSKSRTRKLGESLVANHGPKLPGAKQKSKVEIFERRSGQPVILSAGSKFDPARHVKRRRIWLEDPLGVRCGIEKLEDYEIDNLREESISRRLKESKAQVHVINHAGALNFTDELVANRYDMVVVDESTVIKNPKSVLLDACCDIAKRARYRIAGTGTPAPNGPQDLWAQMFFVDRGMTLGSNYRRFLATWFDLHYEDVGAKQPVEKWTPKIGTLDKINELMHSRQYRVKLRDCCDLPPLTVTIRDVYLTEDQRQAYENMRKNLVAEYLGTVVEAKIALSKFMKLRHITGGFLKKTGDDPVPFAVNPKLDTILEFIEELPPEEQIVIFAVYRWEIDLLLSKIPNSVAIYGGVNTEKKFKAEKDFREGRVRVVICQPQSAAHGIATLTVARYLLFYGLDYSEENFYQAIKRIERMSQTRAMFVYFFLAKKSIDEIIYKTVLEKDAVQSELMDKRILEALCSSP